MAIGINCTAKLNLLFPLFLATTEVNILTIDAKGIDSPI